MTRKTVQFATQKKGKKTVVLREVREFDPSTSRKDGKVGVHPASAQLKEDKKKGLELRRWVNKTEKHLKTLTKNLKESETLVDYEKHLTEFIKTLEYQLERIDEHRALCEKRGRVSIFTDKNTLIPEPRYDLFKTKPMSLSGGHGARQKNANERNTLQRQA